MNWQLPKGDQGSISNGSWKRHHDDHWIDEIRLVRSGRGKMPKPDDEVLRIVTRYRYKTSGLSGDEWRTSTMWQRKDGGVWADFDGGYSSIDTGCAALYPGIYTSHPELHAVPIGNTVFLRKGRGLYGLDYEGEARPLLVTAGHLPWALMTVGERPDFPHTDDETRCGQAGCAEEACSVYRYKKTYCNGGHESEPHWPSFIRFCQKHLRRGDCGLEDADVNYEVVYGPGPDGAQGWKDHESPSVFGGTVTFP